MLPVRSQRQIVSQFVMLISDEWTGQVAEVTAALHGVGARINFIDAENAVVEGVIRRNDFEQLSRLRFARRVTSSATYLLEAPLPPHRHAGVNGSFLRGSRPLRRRLGRGHPGDDDVRRADRMLTRPGRNPRS